MAVAFILDFAGGTQADYDAVMDDMALGGRLPDGALYHGAGATPEGWRVIDVWESDAAFERFATEKIGPLTAARGMAEPSIERVEAAMVRPGADPSAAVAFAQVVRLAGMDGDGFSTMDAQILPDGSAPDGCAFHINGPGQDGWVVIDFWTSREIRDAFIAERVQPAMAAAGATEPPAFEDLDLHNSLRPAGAAV